MVSVNKVFLLGRVISWRRIAPQENGTGCLEIQLATQSSVHQIKILQQTEKWKRKQGGKAVQFSAQNASATHAEPLAVHCVVAEDTLAQTTAAFLHTGALLHVEGELFSRTATHPQQIENADTALPQNNIFAQKIQIIENAPWFCATQPSATAPEAVRQNISQAQKTRSLQTAPRMTLPALSAQQSLFLGQGGTAWKKRALLHAFLQGEERTSRLQ